MDDWDDLDLVFLRAKGEASHKGWLKLLKFKVKTPSTSGVVERLTIATTLGM